MGIRLAKKLDDAIGTIDGVKVTVSHEKEYRGVLILDAPDLSGCISDTDPERVGFAPLMPAPTPDCPKGERARAKSTAAVVAKFVSRAKKLLADEHPANFVLLRGFDRYHPMPDFQEIFKLRACAIASYPMYRGLARLVGMKVLPTGETLEEEVATLEEAFDSYTFFFLHIKKTDTAGEDGDRSKKISVIEATDRFMPRITRLGFDVIAVTGDHSTPTQLKSHSWHPLPVLIHSNCCRPDRVRRFGESDCAAGGLGRMPAEHLMPILMANALKLKKFGA